ncbi:MAG: baseplate J/gp47 family protein, partial [Cyclobacteriaceae bacterium]
MTKNCFNNPVVRDGTSQQMRLIKSLLPEYVAVDERDFDELKRFVLDFSKELRFYDNQHNQSGNWYDFFNQKISTDQRTEPHYALFQAFLELFSIAQTDLNTLTGRHLDYYYEEVLRLKEKAPVPDQVFVIFELAKHVSESGHLITEGTLLNAGTDALGNDVVYRTNQDITINKASVVELKGLYKDPTSSRIYNSSVANSSDGMGADIESDSGSWLPFGNEFRQAADIGFAIASPVFYLAEGTRTVKIQLTFREITQASQDALAALSTSALNQIFQVWFSGEKEWIYPTPIEEVPEDEFEKVVSKRIVKFMNEVSVWNDITALKTKSGPIKHLPSDKTEQESVSEAVARKIIAKRSALPEKQFKSISNLAEVNGLGANKIADMKFSFRNTFTDTYFDFTTNTLCLTRTISRDQKPIVGYIEKALKDPLKTTLPVAKILLNTAPDLQYIYDDLADLKIMSATVSVDVADVANLIVRNDQTVMDPAKTIQPFGIQPVLGANFYIGSHEVFRKQLDYLKLNLEWYGLPTEDVVITEEVDNVATTVTYKGFDAHYSQFITQLRNTSFKTRVSILDKKTWKVIGEDINLFADNDNIDLQPERVIEFVNNQQLADIDRDIEMETFRDLDTSTRKGFVKLELTGSDFGHKEFPPSFTRKVLEGLDDENVLLPRDPYTPLLAGVTLDYRSGVCIKFDDNVSSDCREEIQEAEQYFQVTPFGINEVEVEEPGSKNFLPQFRNEGEFYFGLEKVFTPQNVSVLFQLLEGSEDPLISKPDLRWEFLSASGWVEFDQSDILSDSTNGLVRSGIIIFSIPKIATSDTTVLTNGLHWIRVSVVAGSRAIPEFISVVAQAIMAEFDDNNNDEQYLATTLAAETISKLAFSDSAVKKLIQPFASFGGKVRETNTAFYNRVSERLRHKQRAITIWDYERIVLEEFPSVYKVKCLNHTRYVDLYKRVSNVAPGHVTLIIVPNAKNRNTVDPIRPLTSINTLTEINSYLDPYRAPALTLQVLNPIYEGIKVDFKVKFRDGRDIGFYKRQLEDEIKAFLSPWAYDNSPEIVFGGKIHQSTIINFIDERDYVDFVTCFKMYHTEASVGALTETAATTSASILSSVGKVNSYGDHLIEVLDEVVDCEKICDDNIVAPPPVILSADTCTTEDPDPDSPNEADPYDFSIPDPTLCTVVEVIDECIEVTDEDDPDAIDPDDGDDVIDPDDGDGDIDPDDGEDDIDPDDGEDDIDPDDGDDNIDPEEGDDVIDSEEDTEIMIGYGNDANLYETHKGESLISHTNKRYIIPKSFAFTTGIRITSVIDTRTFEVNGDWTNSGYNRLENQSNISGAYAIATRDDAPKFDGAKTRIKLSDKDHDFEVGDFINL